MTKFAILAEEQEEESDYEYVSGSEEEEEEESGDGVSEEEEEESGSDGDSYKKNKLKTVNAEFDEEDETDQKRVKKSKGEVIRSHIEELHRKSKNLVESNEFLELCGLYKDFESYLTRSKRQQVLEKEKPKAYFRFIVFLREEVAKAYEEYVKRGKKTATYKALKAAKLALAKAALAKDVDEFVDTPDEEEEQGGDEDWDTDSEKEEEYEEGFIVEKLDESRDIRFPAKWRNVNFWLKKEEKSTGKGGKGSKVRTKKKPRKKKVTKKHIVEKDEEYDPEILLKSLLGIRAQRGLSNRNIDRPGMIKDLLAMEEEANRAEDTDIVVLANLSAMGVYYDMFMGRGTLTHEIWMKCFATLEKVVELLTDNIKTVRLTTDLEFVQKSILAGGSREAKIFYVGGNLWSHCQKLHSEWIEALKSMANSPEDLEKRVEDKELLLRLAHNIMRYHELLEKTGSGDPKVAIDLDYRVILSLELMKLQYWTYQPDFAFDFKIAERKEVFEVCLRPLGIELEKLGKTVFMDGNEEQIFLSILYRVYHYALHGHYFKSRDLLFTSGIVEHIVGYEDENLLMLYNRCRALQAISAFKLGLFSVTTETLNEFLQQGYFKTELLAQGSGNTSYWRSHDLDYTKILPQPMHINANLLESLYFISSMILEIPTMARECQLVNSGTNLILASSSQSHMQAKTFRSFFQQFQSRQFQGAAETNRERVMVASQRLFIGEWVAAVKYLEQLSFWNDNVVDAEHIRAIIIKNCKIIGLQSFVIGDGGSFLSIGLKDLANDFQLSYNEVHQVLARMIFVKHLDGVLDDSDGPDKIFLMLKTKRPSNLQNSALNFIETLNQFIDLKPI